MSDGEWFHQFDDGSFITVEFSPRTWALPLRVAKYKRFIAITLLCFTVAAGW